MAAGRLRGFFNGLLGISRDSVYQARTRLLAKLRLELDAVERILDPE
jgi:hypothetical protein